MYDLHNGFISSDLEGHGVLNAQLTRDLFAIAISYSSP